MLAICDHDACKSNFCPHCGESLLKTGTDILELRAHVQSVVNRHVTWLQNCHNQEEKYHYRSHVKALNKWRRWLNALEEVLSTASGD